MAVLLALLALPPADGTGPAAWAAATAADAVCAATPPATDTAASPTADAAAGTPVARAGLVVALRPARERAGPNELAVLVRDAACAPVAGARVTVETRSLEMDHGVRATEAVAEGPGRYVAADVPMGMAGAWRVEVTVARPGAAPVSFVFVVALEGPR